MAVQIINPADNDFPMEPLTAEADTANEDQFAWVPLSAVRMVYITIQIPILIGTKILMCRGITPYQVGGRIRKGERRC